MLILKLIEYYLYLVKFSFLLEQRDMTAKICHWPQQLFNTNCKVFPGRMLIENFSFFFWIKKNIFLFETLIYQYPGFLKWANLEDYSVIYQGFVNTKKTLRWLEMILRCICNKLTILWRSGQCFDCRIVFFCCWTDFNGFYYFCKVLYFIYCHYYSIHDTCMIFRLHIFSWYFSFFVYFFFHHLANHWDWLSNYTEWLVQNLIYAPYVIHNKSEFKQKNLNINLE